MKSDKSWSKIDKINSNIPIVTVNNTNVFNTIANASNDSNSDSSYQKGLLDSLRDMISEIVSSLKLLEIGINNFIESLTNISTVTKASGSNDVDSKDTKVLETIINFDKVNELKAVIMNSFQPLITAFTSKLFNISKIGYLKEISNNIINNIVQSAPYTKVSEMANKLISTLKSKINLDKVKNISSGIMNSIASNTQINNILSFGKKVSNALNGIINVDALKNKMTNFTKGIMNSPIIGQFKKLGTQSISEALKNESGIQDMTSIFKNKDVAGEFYNSIEDKANSSAFTSDDFLNNAKTMGQFTNNSDKLAGLGNITEKLTIGNSNKDFSSSTAAIQSAVKGDYSTLSNDFNFSEVEVGILKSSKSLDEFISKFDNIMNNKGITDDLVGEFSSSPLVQIENIKSKWNSMLGDIGKKGLDTLAPVFDMVLSLLNSDEATYLFTKIGEGIGIVANVIVKLVEGIKSIGTWFKESFGSLEPILNFIAAIIIGVLLVALWAMVAPILVMSLKILLIVGIIVLLVNILNYFGISTEEIIGFVCGLFSMLLAVLANIFMGILQIVFGVIEYFYNWFAAIANFISNVFRDPIGSAIALFGDLADNVLGVLEKIASGIDFIFGSKLADTVSGWRAGLKTKVDAAIKEYGNGEYEKKVDDLDINSILGDMGLEMDRFSYGDSFQSGYDFGSGIGSNISSGLEDILNKYNDKENDDKGNNDVFNNLNNQSGINNGLSNLNNNATQTNDTLGNIDDKIDVSNEHLEIMRDLAEQESIQNFVTLTPTVQVTTGDIKEEADIKSIISKIENYMQNELVSSAEGVYS